MRKMDREVDTADTVRIFSHGPLCLYAKPVCPNPVPRTEPPDKIAHATCNGPDKQFHRTESLVLAAVLDRLIGDNPVSPTDDVMPSAALV
jgi:hypothetical protein